MTPVARSSGRSSVAAGAYRAGVVLTNERDGRVHDYSHRHGVIDATIILPPGCEGDAWALDRSRLWNAAEAAEKRKDARTATEIVVALPHELTEAQQIGLAHDFAAGLAERYGVAVDVAVHRPHESKDIRNVHAHLLMTTRRIEASGLGEKSMLELSNTDLGKLGLPTRTGQLQDIREDWETTVNHTLAREGIDARIDRRSHQERGLELEPTQHVGVTADAMRKEGKSPRKSRIDAEAARRNAERVQRNPAAVLSIITQEKSVFDHRDVARALHRYIDTPDAFQAAYAKVMASPVLMKLQDERTGPNGRSEPAKYTTTTMFQTEHDMAVRAERMARASGFRADAAPGIASFERRQGFRLKAEQREAVLAVTGGEQIAVVSGLAGAGKSTMMGAAHAVWRQDGRQIFGAALSGKAAEGLEESAGIKSRTLASWERSWEAGRHLPQRGDVFVIDEAGMVSSEQMARFVKVAETAGAKLVLVGDAEQLQPINAGAAFKAIAERIGCVDLAEVTRQKEGWMREASVAFGRTQTRAGLAAYDTHGAIDLRENRDAVIAAIIRDAVADAAQRPGGSRIVLAHRRDDVRALNDGIRAARQGRGELAGEAGFQTAEGERRFAAGDRLVFLKNDKDLGVKNGAIGTVVAAEEGRVTVRMDGRGGRIEVVKHQLGKTIKQLAGRVVIDTGKPVFVTVEAQHYNEIDHGYATTIHKSQGATVDRAFVMASESMDRHLTYVGMTRHREAVTLYAARDEFRDKDALYERLSRARIKETTLDYTERRGLGPASEIALREPPRPRPQWPPPPEQPGRERDSLRERVAAARERQAPQPTPAKQSVPPVPEYEADSLREQVAAARARRALVEAARAFVEEGGMAKTGDQLLARDASRILAEREAARRMLAEQEADREAQRQEQQRAREAEDIRERLEWEREHDHGWEDGHGR